jgi:uncharacterized repeat protein (TIGR03803 family)
MNQLGIKGSLWAAVLAFSLILGTPATAAADDAGTAVDVTSRVRTLHDFGLGADGAVPVAALMQALDGALYGTTVNGGAYGQGTVYRRSPEGVHAVLHSFSGPDGKWPQGELVQGDDGRLYSTTEAGGKFDRGSVFSVGLDGSFRLLHSFNGSSGAGAFAGLTKGLDGHFYGGTAEGGAERMGTLFRITADGEHTLLHSFERMHGRVPQGPWERMVRGQDGHFYGISGAGGENQKGGLFRLTAAGEYTLVYSFDVYSEIGFNPDHALAAAADGGFFGIAVAGGPFERGTVFHITPDGQARLVYAADGQYGALASVMQASDGYLYGGFLPYGGRLFRLSTDGKLNPLRRLPQPVDPYDLAYASNQMLQASDGWLYGTSLDGGEGGQSGGILFRLSAVRR